MSVRELSDDTARVTDQYDYDAFGRLLHQEGSSSNPHRYTGERLDPGLNHYYLRARYYNTDLGRFLTSDPFQGRIIEPQTLHKYVYTANSPVDHTDPQGLFLLGMGDVIASVNINSMRVENAKMSSAQGLAIIAKLIPITISLCALQAAMSIYSAYENAYGLFPACRSRLPIFYVGATDLPFHALNTAVAHLIGYPSVLHRFTDETRTRNYRSN